MMNSLNEKIDYSRDPEGPISLGMKILKKLEKEGWKGADVYDAIEEIIIMSDVQHPKQMALRLKRTLENYDMWEAPYKGLVNKIEKWQFVNENLAAFAGKMAGRAIIANTARRFGKQMRNLRNNESTDNLDDDNSYYDKINDPKGETIKYQINIEPHCDRVVYKRLFSGDFVRNVVLDYEDDNNVIYVSAPAGQYRNMENALNSMLRNGVIDDFEFLGTGNKINESAVNMDDKNNIYYRPIDVKELMQKSKSAEQLSKFEYWVLEAALWARARSNNYHGYAKEIPAVKYKNGKFYASTKQDGMTEVPFNYKVMTPEWLFESKSDVKDGLKAYHVNENVDDYNVDDFENLKNIAIGVLDHLNQEGVRNWEENDLLDYISGNKEPNYELLIKFILEDINEEESDIISLLNQYPNTEYIEDIQVALLRAMEDYVGDISEACKINEDSNDLSDEVYMIVYADDNFSIDDIKKFIIIFKDDIVYEDENQIEFYTSDWKDIQDELDNHGIEWEEDKNY